MGCDLLVTMVGYGAVRGQSVQRLEGSDKRPDLQVGCYDWLGSFVKNGRIKDNCPAESSVSFLRAINLVYSSTKVVPGGRKANYSG